VQPEGVNTRERAGAGEARDEEREARDEPECDEERVSVVRRGGVLAGRLNARLRSTY
jgi:hypothetical protein